ncbi:hypothetical protein [Niabella aurantiaca]|uniref:hypothetical protein n=1 Tax=Niabella aurantiaca TaxID=379900 RepID=UPI000360B127|nr:hypothetical protein [Niabella aurantiaca]
MYFEEVHHLADAAKSWKSCLDYGKLYAREKRFTKAWQLLQRSDSLLLKIFPLNSASFKKMQKHYGEIQFHTGLVAGAGMTGKEAARPYFVKAKEYGFPLPDQLRQAFDL